MNNLAVATRTAVKGLVGPADIQTTIATLKAAGAVRGIHVGIVGGDFTREMKVEWYAGQVLEVLESGSLFAVNSIVNSLDVFVPEAEP